MNITTFRSHTNTHRLDSADNTHTDKHGDKHTVQQRCALEQITVNHLSLVSCVAVQAERRRDTS